MFEVLNGFLVFPGCLDAGERAQIPALVCFRILFARVNAKLAGF